MSETTIDKTETRKSAEYACDRCGKPSGYSAREVEVSHGSLVTNRATVVLRRRESVAIGVEKSRTTRYSEDGGDVERISYDVCADCFREVVMPAMEGLGFKRRETESDW